MKYKVKYFFAVTLLIGFLSKSNAQIIHVGGKLDKNFMFNATLQAPFFFHKKMPYELMFGLDYTTKNQDAPSGLAPQVTFGYFLVDSPSKSYLVFAGLTSGYLFDFNKQFDNQLRLSPHLYTELGFVTVKVGGDYLPSMQKIYPFLSLGIGGGHLFRHFKIM